MSTDPEHFQDDEPEPQPVNSRGFTEDQWLEYQDRFSNNYPSDVIKARTEEAMGERPPSLEQIQADREQREINFRAVEAGYAARLAEQIDPIENHPIMSREEKDQKINEIMARYLAKRQIHDRASAPVRRK